MNYGLDVPDCLKRSVFCELSDERGCYKLDLMFPIVVTMCYASLLHWDPTKDQPTSVHDFTYS